MSTDTPAAAPITAEREARMAQALQKIIQWNRTHARDQYGDADKAEAWACVREARAALSAPVAKQCPWPNCPHGEECVHAAPVAAQPAVSGVDAQWVETANAMLGTFELAVFNNTACYGNDANRRKQLEDARAALRTHLSTALTGAAKE